MLMQIKKFAKIVFFMLVKWIFSNMYETSL